MLSLVQVVTKDEDGNDFKPADPDDDPQSVIHAPSGYQTFVRPSRTWLYAES